MAARKLRRKQGRAAESAFLIEGPTVIGDAFDAGAELRDVFLEDSDDNQALRNHLESREVPLWTVGRDVIKALTETVTPQGAVAVASDPTLRIESLSEPDLVVVLADVRDPGNAGTLIRSSLAAGASAVVFTKGSVDPLHPKVARAAAASLFGLPVVSGVELNEALGFLKDSGLSLIGTSAAGSSVYDADLTSPIALVLGNEARGLPDEIEARLDSVVGIPMPGPAESLNVSVAGSVLLFEALRQRQFKGKAGEAPGLSSAPND